MHEVEVVRRIFALAAISCFIVLQVLLFTVQF